MCLMRSETSGPPSTPGRRLRIEERAGPTGSEPRELRGELNLPAPRPVFDRIERELGVEGSNESSARLIARSPRATSIIPLQE